MKPTAVLAWLIAAVGPLGDMQLDAWKQKAEKWVQHQHFLPGELRRALVAEIERVTVEQIAHVHG